MFLPLDEVTADELNQRLGLVARRFTDQAAPQNATALINDNALVLAVPAGTNFLFECQLRYSANVAADLKWSFALPPGAGTGFLYSALHIPAGGAALIYSDMVSSAVGTAEGAAIGHVRMSGVLDTDAAGNLQLQFAQNTAHASDTKILAGSFMVLRKI